MKESDGGSTSEHVIAITLVALVALGAWQVLGDAVHAKTTCAASAIGMGIAVRAGRPCGASGGRGEIGAATESLRTDQPAVDRSANRRGDGLAFTARADDGGSAVAGAVRDAWDATAGTRHAVSGALGAALTLAQHGLGSLAPGAPELLSGLQGLASGERAVDILGFPARAWNAIGASFLRLRDALDVVLHGSPEERDQLVGRVFGYAMTDAAVWALDLAAPAAERRFRANGRTYDGATRAPHGASPLFRRMFRAARSELDGATTPAELFVTYRNHVSPHVLLRGPEVFRAMRHLIASAKHEVAFQMYVWDPQSYGGREIVRGVADLEARLRARAGPPSEPVEVRILLDEIGPGLGPSPVALARQRFAALGLDPRLVRVTIEGFAHAALGNLHSKSLIVDGRTAIVTGANAEATTDPPDPWNDAGFRVDGEVALALLAEHDDAWREAGHLPPVSHRTLPARVGGARVPIMVLGRRSDANPFSNRQDNPQDRALIAAFEGARRRIRIATPNLNDDAVKRALLDAARRGVEVEVVLSEGFNSFGESLPGQGGTNEDTVRDLYGTLVGQGAGAACRRLRVRWYRGTSKSHLKYTSIDGEVAIVGSANMNTQAWNHSRELNLAVDSRETTRAWDAQVFDPTFAAGEPAGACE